MACKSDKTNSTELDQKMPSAGTERRRNRTFQAWGCHALPVLKTGSGTSRAPLRGRSYGPVTVGQNGAARLWPERRRADPGPMRLHRILLAASLSAAVFPAVALGAPRNLTLRQANRAADNTASDIADNWQADDGTSIDDYSLTPCVKSGLRKADCAVTYSLDDGSTCSDTIHVRLIGRGRGHYVTSSDSDDGDTQTFKTCTAPAADPSATDPSATDGSSGDGSSSDTSSATDDSGSDT